MIGLYAVCSRNGTRLIAEYEGVPVFNEYGNTLSHRGFSVLHGCRCESLPNFPKPESYKKIKRLSLLPLEIEYEDPPVELKLWACTNPDGSRNIRRDDTRNMVYTRRGDREYWSGGLFFTGSGILLDSIPGWPPPGERREIKAIVYMWADEGN